MWRAAALRKQIALPDIIVQNQPLEKPLIYFFQIAHFPVKIQLFLCQDIECPGLIMEVDSNGKI